MNVNIIWMLQERDTKRTSRPKTSEKDNLMWKELPWNQKVLTLFQITSRVSNKLHRGYLIYYISVCKIRENAYLIGNSGTEKSVSNLQTYQISCTKMRFPQLLPNPNFHTASPACLCWAVLQLPFSSHLSVTVPGSLQPLVPLFSPTHLFQGTCATCGQEDAACLRGSPVCAATHLRCYRSGEVKFLRW